MSSATPSSFGRAESPNLRWAAIAIYKELQFPYQVPQFIASPSRQALYPKPCTSNHPSIPNQTPLPYPKNTPPTHHHHASPTNHHPNDHLIPRHLRNRHPLDLHRRLHNVAPAPLLPPQPPGPNRHPHNQPRDQLPPGHRLAPPARQILRPTMPHAARDARPRSRHPGRLQRHLARDDEPRPNSHDNRTQRFPLRRRARKHTRRGRRGPC